MKYLVGFFRLIALICIGHLIVHANIPTANKIAIFVIVLIYETVANIRMLTYKYFYIEVRNLVLAYKNGSDLIKPARVELELKKVDKKWMSRE